ncbi:uncharacterized protein LOC131018438 [Salvia miltiorrhiza]|uniref:uncharacterized protein LOC131018438 n=1 Tax=Salvia miltiorrhiza TaxID=226208 RepID=UPI0025AB606A|nr:uncharacterized protein LOC131018438 [Salvia miltiorrhiza]
MDKRKRGIESYFQKQSARIDVGGSRSSNPEVPVPTVDAIEKSPQQLQAEVPCPELPPLKITKIGNESDDIHVERDPEYSPSENAVFCFPCFLFAKIDAKYGGNAFVVGGFRTWKRVNNGKKCAFLIHVGSAPNSAHKHIGRVVDKQTSDLVRKNRLRVKASIDVAKLCALLGIAFRGRDESPDSRNRGNFLEILKYTASYNEEVASVVLENAPKNASYTSHSIQKEILSVYASKIQKFIRAEIGDEKFCIIVDESRDESKREQMAIILRFVDKDGFVRERFFDIVHVEDTKAATLKNKISEVLSYHNLSIQSIRGQGYDGASNMRGEWHGLEALFLNECPYAYYIHCFAHRLQLILVATSQKVISY